MILVTLVVTFILFLYTSKLVYRYLEKIKIIPERFHPYTNKKSQRYYWEFTKLYFFVVVTLVFLVGGYFSIFLALGVITLLQIGANFVIYKREFVLNDEIIEVTCNDEDEKEFNKYVESLPLKETKKIIFTKKFVYYDEHLYWGKRKKVLVRERMYKYIFLTHISKKNRMVTLKYGFLGLPMFKKQLFIPSKQDRSFMKIYRKIEEKRRTPSFTQKYMSVFKRG